MEWLSKYKIFSHNFSLIAIIIVGLVSRTTSETDVGCDRIVTVLAKERDSYLGHVSFEAPEAVRSGQWKLNGTTNGPFMSLQCWHARVVENGPEGKTQFFSDDNVIVQKGQNISFKFRLLHAMGQPMPKFSQLVWENTVICSQVESLGSRERKVADAETVTIPLWLLILVLVLWTLCVSFYVLTLCCRKQCINCIKKARPPRSSDRVELFNSESIMNISR